MIRFLIALCIICTASLVHARSIKIVGSSTVFPYTRAVSEEFSHKGFKAPVVESTGTGGGMKVFCSGVGSNIPDITGASRHIKFSELDECAKNNVVDITEILLGYDGITISVSIDAETMLLTREMLWKALAEKVMLNDKLVDNPYKSWHEVDPSLPAKPILVYGPPPTSGTRDSFVELVFHPICEEKKISKDDCTSMRVDGPFIEAGENDNLIIKRLERDSNALGIFGFSFFYENQDVIKALNIDGAKASFETIANKTYPLFRPLFLYVKNKHKQFSPDIEAFIEEILSEEVSGEEGYLVEHGLIPVSSDDKRTKDIKAFTKKDKGK